MFSFSKTPCEPLLGLRNIYFVCVRVLAQLGFPGGTTGKDSPANAGDTRDVGLVPGELLEEGMASHSSILAWRMPWTEEPGGVQSMRSQCQTQPK